MYARLGATTTTLSPAAQATIAAGVKALPACYDANFHACWYHDQGAAFPNCAAVLEAWKLDEERMAKMVDDLPICTCPTIASRSSVLTWTFAGLSAVLGSMLFLQLRK
jgi:hypothetical protein